jgi:hypothetical protein
MTSLFNSSYTDQINDYMSNHSPLNSIVRKCEGGFNKICTATNWHKLLTFKAYCWQVAFFTKLWFDVWDGSHEMENCMPFPSSLPLEKLWVIILWWLIFRRKMTLVRCTIKLKLRMELTFQYSLGPNPPSVRWKVKEINVRNQRVYFSHAR